jgi:pyruvate kinase
VVKKV